jgi:hypothetical protein
MRSVTRTEVEQGLTAFDRNFDNDLVMAAFGEILMLTWEELL